MQPRQCIQRDKNTHTRKRRILPHVPVLGLQSTEHQLHTQAPVIQPKTLRTIDMCNVSVFAPWVKRRTFEELVLTVQPKDRYKLKDTHKSYMISADRRVVLVACAQMRLENPKRVLANQPEKKARAAGYAPA